VRGLAYRARATLRGAAAAIPPPQLLEWALAEAARADGHRTVAELSAGGGAAGMTGLIRHGSTWPSRTARSQTGGEVVSSPGHHAKVARQRSVSVRQRAASSGMAGMGLPGTRSPRPRRSPIVERALS